MGPLAPGAAKGFDGRPVSGGAKSGPSEQPDSSARPEAAASLRKRCLMVRRLVNAPLPVRRRICATVMRKAKGATMKATMAQAT